MGVPRLARLRIYVQTDDGAEFTVHAVNVDMTSWDRERARRGWPAATDAPMLWANYLAWHHLTKVSHELPEMTLDAFESLAVHVSPIDDDETEDDAADPTSRVVERE